MTAAASSGHGLEVTLPTAPLPPSAPPPEDTPLSSIGSMESCSPVGHVPPPGPPALHMDPSLVSGHGLLLPEAPGSRLVTAVTTETPER